MSALPVFSLSRGLDLLPSRLKCCRRRQVEGFSTASGRFWSAGRQDEGVPFKGDASREPGH
jgi:hypothetical protein